MKLYIGQRSQHGCTVTVIDADGNQSPLNPRHDLRNHSPDGFNWGYGGSGPAQLALAMLADALGDDDRAQRQYQDYKWKVLAGIAGDRWQLSDVVIGVTVARMEQERDQGRGR